MPLQETSGAASYDAFGGGAPVAAKYIEDFFQTWLRTGTGSSTTVTTGLNASINKSLVWTKSRSAATNHKLTDTARGVTKALSSNTTGAEVTDSQGLTAFSSTGYTIGTNTDYNNSGATYVDGQFVATPKFFDVVTYTGDGTVNRAISHSLGSSPGAVIVKAVNTAGYNWAVRHRSATGELYLNTTGSQASSFSEITGVSSTTFTVTAGQNNSGITYVAYLFAHNAGGFGLSGTDNVISCGSFTTPSSGYVNIDLGYEPQWILIKTTGVSQDWFLVDNMRGIALSASPSLSPNLSSAESSPSTDAFDLNATGFRVNSASFGTNRSFIYIAIRRGPMRTPTTGTSVFAPIARNGTGSTTSVTGTGFPPDFVWIKNRGAVAQTNWFDKLRGPQLQLLPAITNAESTNTDKLSSYDQDGFSFSGGSSTVNASGNSYINYCLRRAPSVFDEVCYTGTGANRTVAHNLSVVPELMIIKSRSANYGWPVYSAAVGNTAFAYLDEPDAFSVNSTAWNNTSPTSSVFTVGTGPNVNESATTFVAYLFASCPGVSKVGSYTGTGTTQTINCGFTGGARFVLIKTTNTTGSWYYWDSARGIVAGNDPYLVLDTTDAEVTGTDWVDTAASGFELSNAGGNLANSNGVSYIFLAIA